MNKKGFTMVELIAIVIILAAMSLITFTAYNTIIKNTTISNEKDLVRNIIMEANVLYNDYVLKDKQEQLVNKNIFDLIKIEDKPSSGYLIINDYGNVAIAILIDDRCYKKDYENNTINLLETINCEDLESYKPLYKDIVLNGADPELDEGMIPVIIDDDGTLTKASLKEEWYNYSQKKWANVVLVNETSRSKYKEADSGTQIYASDVLAYFVWIPRYKYQIFNDVDNILTGQDYEKNTVELINIVFQDKDAIKASGTKEGQWLTHPAFTFGDKELNGIWVGKFETTGTAKQPTILPNKTSLRNQNVSSQFKTSLLFANNTLNSDGSITHSNNTTYGINNTDSHMMKNMEWGAVAYLTTSKYGQGTTEVRINNSSKYITGCAATTPAINFGYPEYPSQTNGSEGAYSGCENMYNTQIGILASTTGNITGVYDMAGGSSEYVMGVLEDSLDSNIPTSGKSNTYNSGFTGNFVCVKCDNSNETISSTIGTTFPNNKYYDLYDYGTSAINEVAYKRSKLGDSIVELGSFTHYTSSVDNTIRYYSNWHKDRATLVYPTLPWFIRGMTWNDGANSGIYSSYIGHGAALGYISFRTVLVK